MNSTRPSSRLSTADFSFAGPLGSEGARIEQTGPERFLITLAAAPGHPEWPNKLNFRITANGRGLAPVIEVVFPGSSQMPFNQYPQAWSVDGMHWTPLAWEHGDRQSPQRDVLRLPRLETDTLHVGTQTPLSHEQLMERVKAWQAHPCVSVHTLGRSLLGRELVRVTITDPHSPHPARLRWAHHISLQHPGEFNAQWRLVGMIECLLRDDPAAADARARHIFHFVPTMSPDGPSHGWYRVNASGWDMNRTYLASGADAADQPSEAYDCQRDLEKLMRSQTPLVTAWSMHTWPGIVEPIVICGQEYAGELGPPEEFEAIMRRHDGRGLIKPLQFRTQPRKPGLRSWGSGPFEQFGITTVLCEGGSHANLEENLTAGATLARSLSEYYAGLRKRG